uniref:Odorant receptor n=1 Tax=Sirex noctilio TaxID=36765 RepID=A0A857N9Y2_9HYME|nr:odorant receptor 37 [Sirex noctilio]
MGREEARERQSPEHVQNKTYKSDVEFAMQLSHCLLKIIGTWPVTSGASRMEKIRPKILIATCCFLLGFLIVPCWLNILLKEDDGWLRLKMLGPLNFCTMALMKYCVLISHGNGITHCIRFVETDWRNVKFDEDWKIMTRNAKLGRYVTILCFVFMYSAGTFFSLVMPLTSGNPLPDGNVSVRPFNFPGYYVFFDAQPSPNYEVVFSLHFICTFVMFTTTTGIYSLAIMLVMHACGQFQIVMSRLENLVNGNERECDTLEERLTVIVEHHLRIFRFSARMEKALHQIWLVEVMSCTTSICFAGYYLMREWKHSERISVLTYISLLVSFIFNIFMLCYIGEILIEQCRKIGTISYMIDWYDLPKRKALDLVLVIAISNRVTKMTAGKFMDLTLSNFCTILKASVAYFNMLRNMTT